MFIGGSWVGRLYDNYGPRYLILVGWSLRPRCWSSTDAAQIGSFLHVFGLMMASISHQYYQFLLSQAVCSSIGASMVFYPAFSATVTWFYQRRAVAVGIVAAGSSLGGVIFPIMVARLVGEVGFAWTMRICAFLILALLIVANLFIKSRIPPFPKPVKLMDFIKPLTEPTFALLTIVWPPFLPRFRALTNSDSRASSSTIWVFLYLLPSSSSKPQPKEWVQVWQDIWSLF